MKKVILTGAQGTGKTTVLNEFKNMPEFSIITEVVRNLHKNRGININEMGDMEGQEAIFDTYMALFDEENEKSIVSDRGLTDVLAYSIYMYLHNSDRDPVAQEEMRRFLLEQLNDYKAFNKRHPECVYCYFPIEFDVEDDGVRSTSEDFRNEIDKIIKGILVITETPHVTVSGTVNERLDQILYEIDDPQGQSDE